MFRLRPPGVCRFQKLVMFGGLCKGGFPTDNVRSPSAAMVYTLSMTSDAATFTATIRGTRTVSHGKRCAACLCSEWRPPSRPSRARAARRCNSLRRSRQNASCSALSCAAPSTHGCSPPSSACSRPLASHGELRPFDARSERLVKRGRGGASHRRPSTAGRLPRLGDLCLGEAQGRAAIKETG